MNLRDRIGALAWFARARWGRQRASRRALLAWQRKAMRRWMRTILPRAAFYANDKGASLHELPIVDKQAVLDDFAAFNTRGIGLAAALAAAQANESEIATMDDGPHDAPDLSFGLSSGTRGARSVFIATARERSTWAGILLARVLTPALLKIVLFRRAPLRIAFFLRANNRLYTTLSSRRIDIRFFDLMDGVESRMPALQDANPEVLVAPASVLAWIGAEKIAGRIALDPLHVISVAEVLEGGDEKTIRAAFDRVVHQIYQCTEGFLASTCAEGTLHLNEDFVHVEPEWLDAERSRFTPVITDFTRTTQLFVRYRLDDVLRVKASGCRCGSPLLAIEAIEGRGDDVLWLRSAHADELRPIFPDALRHAIARRNPADDYRLEQHDQAFVLSIKEGSADAYGSISSAVDEWLTSQRLSLPTWRRVVFSAEAPGQKRRRIRCVRRPGTAPSTLPRACVLSS